MILMKVLIFLEKKTTSTDGETTAVEKQEEYILKIVIIFSFRIKKMSDAVTKYENVFPEKCITVHVWRMQLMKFFKEKFVPILQ